METYIPTNQEIVNYVFGEKNEKIDELCEKDLVFCDNLNDIMAIKIHGNYNREGLLNFLEKDCKEIEEFIDNLK